MNSWTDFGSGRGFGTSWRFVSEELFANVRFQYLVWSMWSSALFHRLLILAQEANLQCQLKTQSGGGWLDWNQSIYLLFSRSKKFVLSVASELLSLVWRFSNTHGVQQYDFGKSVGCNVKFAAWWVFLVSSGCWANNPVRGVIFSARFNGRRSVISRYNYGKDSIWRAGPYSAAGVVADHRNNFTLYNWWRLVP